MHPRGRDSTGVTGNFLNNLSNLGALILQGTQVIFKIAYVTQMGWFHETYPNSLLHKMGGFMKLAPNFTSIKWGGFMKLTPSLSSIKWGGFMAISPLYLGLSETLGVGNVGL
jgi:hypothetical protein